MKPGDDRHDAALEQLRDRAAARRAESSRRRDRSSVTMPACAPVSASASMPSAPKLVGEDRGRDQLAGSEQQIGVGACRSRRSISPSSVSVAYGSGARPIAETTATVAKPRFARVADAAIRDLALLGRRDRRAAELQNGDARVAFTRAT